MAGLALRHARARKQGRAARPAAGARLRFSHHTSSRASLEGDGAGGPHHHGACSRPTLVWARFPLHCH